MQRGSKRQNSKLKRSWKSSSQKSDERKIVTGCETIVNS